MQRITFDHDDEQPRIRDLDVLVADVLEKAATLDTLQAAADAFSKLTVEDVRAVLVFAAQAVRELHEPQGFLGQSEQYRASQLALKAPSDKARYRLYDAENMHKPLLDATEFQLAFIKSYMMEPHDEEEGWFFDRVALQKMPLHIAALEESIEQIDADAERLEVRLEERAAQGFDVDHDELAKLVVKAELFEAKAEELQALYAALKAAMEDYDAFEVTWEALEG